MSKRKNFRENFDEISLLHTAFPKKENEKAVTLLNKYSRNIKIFAARLFSSNYFLFEKMGLDREDVRSLCSVYAYVFFSKYDESKMNIFNRFMRQKSLNLLQLIKRKSEGILEDPLDDPFTEFSISDRLTHNENPESILIGKETAINLIHLGILK
jgi:hypothetical protein